MLTQLVVTVIMVAMDRGLLDGAVHSFNLPIGPRMPRLGQSVINVTDSACIFKGMAPKSTAFLECLLDIGRCPTFAIWIGELHAIVREDRVNLVRHDFDQIEEELLGGGTWCPFVQLDIGKLASPINGDKEMKLAFCGSHFGNIDMELANRIGLELLLWIFVAFHIWQPFDAVALKAAMQRRPRQVRECWLRAIEAVIQRQKRIAPESNDHSLFLGSEDC
jgi:hypothetical protein